MKKILVMKLGFMVKCEAESNKYADVSGTDNQSSVLLKSVLSIGLQTKDIDSQSVRLRMERLLLEMVKSFQVKKELTQ